MYGAPGYSCTTEFTRCAACPVQRTRQTAKPTGSRKVERPSEKPSSGNASKKIGAGTRAGAAIFGGFLLISIFNALNDSDHPAERPEPVQTTSRQPLSSGSTVYPQRIQPTSEPKHTHQRFKNGSYLIGQTLNGKPHGQAQYHDKSAGITYDGNWVNGVFHGKGRLFTRGLRYEGHFDRWKLSGPGKLIFPDRSYIEGDWNGYTVTNGVCKLRSGEIVKEIPGPLNTSRLTVYRPLYQEVSYQDVCFSHLRDENGYLPQATHMHSILNSILEQTSDHRSFYVIATIGAEGVTQARRKIVLPYNEFREFLLAEVVHPKPENSDINIEYMGQIDLDYIRDGIRHGVGIQWKSTGPVQEREYYVGQWRNGKRFANGLETFSNPENSYIRARWDYDGKIVEGICRTAIYAGYVFDDNKHLGVRVYADGRFYDSGPSEPNARLYVPGPQTSSDTPCSHLDDVPR